MKIIKIKFNNIYLLTNLNFNQLQTIKNIMAATTNEILGLVAFVSVLGYLEYKGKKGKSAQNSSPPEEPEPTKKNERQRVMVEAVLCEQCKKPYIAKVEHQKYCSANCRTKANRK
jgi:hypothetical protein